MEINDSTEQKLILHSHLFYLATCLYMCMPTKVIKYSVLNRCKKTRINLFHWTKELEIIRFMFSVMLFLVKWKHFTIFQDIAKDGIVNFSLTSLISSRLILNMRRFDPPGTVYEASFFYGFFYVRSIYHQTLWLLQRVLDNITNFMQTLIPREFFGSLRWPKNV